MAHVTVQRLLMAVLLIGLAVLAALAARNNYQAREARILASLALLDAIARMVGADARETPVIGPLDIRSFWIRDGVCYIRVPHISRQVYDGPSLVLGSDQYAWPASASSGVCYMDHLRGVATSLVAPTGP